MEMYERVKELGVTTSLDFALPDPNSPVRPSELEQNSEKSLAVCRYFSSQRRRGTIYIG